ncbi:predicted protein [Phaeodactylum tricornutum CCAP 1055/1]|uniref:SET domain-containing protein n=2 Tax=Phaeodactylum tricornutum TaxID=2850 RepID=B7FU17_PHATC|nr:predicted protein [Phaeodactylum tricornutum CCAP 1055/1]EEC49901.1 predicted protein [Phaeodactylum tricornutum CCAP 1055/1]|eukprot:XP_002178236.1 predicted protein [Phaeodactylum tricornutum CCAP 1055/1]
MKGRSTSSVYCSLSFVLVLSTIPGQSEHQTQRRQCKAGNDDDTCDNGHDPFVRKPLDGFPARCGLYMAESSIPHAGWGMYTAQDLFEGDAIQPLDVSIPVFDLEHHQNVISNKFKREVPEWLMGQYYWNADVIYAQFDAIDVKGILPGFGMLANSHVGLVNAENGGNRDRLALGRETPHVGASSHYQDLTFTVLDDLPAGHEIFVEYGDEWFEDRSHVFGDDLPLSHHFESADTILAQWKEVVPGDLESSLGTDLYNLILDGLGHFLSPRLRRALPQTASDAVSQANGQGTAYATVPNVVRDIDWLEENGMCLDNLAPRENVDAGNKGAFATRFLSRGSLVAPAPVIQLSRQHLEMILVDAYDEVLWQGHQLLLNYCYGHAGSSLLFFPYSPATNLINHGSGERANVGVRWSDRMSNPEMLQWTADEILESNEKAGLMMEFYALRDIQPGEEILLDYGDEWQDAWDRHVNDWRPPIYETDYTPAYTFDRHDEIYTLEDGDLYPPPYVQVRCYVNEDEPGVPDEDGWYQWTPVENEDLSYTVPCTVLSSDAVNDKEKAYRVQVNANENLKFKAAPWSSITFIDVSYTGNQHLRQGFRHEIKLPDAMVPDCWRDIENPPDNELCNLFMAESAIPNAGLGMFTARRLDKGELISSGDVVLQIEDADLNKNLRFWRQGITDIDEPPWLLENYFWNPSNTFGSFEAHDVESIVPGLGMLANSHPGLVNSKMLPSSATADLHRGLDPGAGASTHYHNVRFRATDKIEAGTELFVKYGDSWFEEREDLGPIPLSDDYQRADRTVKRFWKIIDGNTTRELARDLWDFILQASSIPMRHNIALPQSLENIESILNKGSAYYSVPDRIKSIGWLEENGRCLDNIRPSQSKLRQAGKGAFATRAIPKGKIIAPMPVAHVRRHHMDIFDSDDHSDPSANVWSDGTQVLMNYCYGHPNSTLLLFPYSPVVNYVNHNATSANAELRWSKLPNHLESWLERTPDSLDSEEHAGLIMELTATRDISAGEEIYLDYGTSWDEAWADYVANKFRPTGEDLLYRSSADLNRRVEWIKTRSELETEPYYFESAFTACFVGRSQRTGNHDEADDSKLQQFLWTPVVGMYDDTYNAYPCTVLERTVNDVEGYAPHRRDSVWPMEVTYKIRLHQQNEGDVIMTQVPRRAIQFFDRAYQSDLFIRSAFRHEIHLPDAMVPPAWRDLIELV